MKKTESSSDLAGTPWENNSSCDADKASSIRQPVRSIYTALAFAAAALAALLSWRGGQHFLHVPGFGAAYGAAAVMILGAVLGSISTAWLALVALSRKEAYSWLVWFLLIPALLIFIGSVSIFT